MALTKLKQGTSTLKAPFALLKVKTSLLGQEQKQFGPQTDHKLSQGLFVSQPQDEQVHKTRAA